MSFRRKEKEVSASEDKTLSTCCHAIMFQQQLKYRGEVFGGAPACSHCLRILGTMKLEPNAPKDFNAELYNEMLNTRYFECAHDKTTGELTLYYKTKQNQERIAHLFKNGNQGILNETISRIVHKPENAYQKESE